jgi:nucleoside-diphosphate-sugar epimerase
MNSLCIDINYLQALEFFKRLASSGVKIIYSLGSMSEYGAGSSSYELFSPKQILHPQTEYARSKSMLCESIALDKAFYGKNLTIRHIRLFYFYGSYESSIRLYPQILSCGITNTDLKLSHGRQVRDISNASEVAIKLFSLLYRDHNFPESNLLTISNLGSGRFLSIREFVLVVYKAHGFSNELLFGFNNLRSDEPMYAIPDLDPSNHLLVALQ